MRSMLPVVRQRFCDWALCILLTMTLTGFLLLISSAIQAHSYAVGKLSILHPYVAATPPGARAAAGYMVIANLTDQNDRLISGTSSIAKRIELHRSVIENDIAKMRHLHDGLILPAGETIVLKPGQSHLMFIGLNQQLVKGERHSVTLVFEKAGKLEMEFVIEDIRSHSGVDHTKMDH